MDAKYDTSNLFKVNGLVAVITGGGTGIGLMMAKALALNGASKVYILGRRLEKLEAAAKSSPHGNIIPIQCDVTSKDALAAAASQVQKEVGFINLLIANSGISGPLLDKLPKDASIKQFQDYCWGWTAEDFTKVYEVNNTSVFFTSIAFLELLDEGNKRNNVQGVTSQIIVTASVASFMRYVLTGFAYVSSKAAATSMSKALSTMLAPHDVRVNAICPGFFPSEMTEEIMKGKSEPGSVSRDFIPLGRFGSEEDMAGTVLYLASKAGGFCNGNMVVMDGGRLGIVPASY